MILITCLDVRGIRKLKDIMKWKETKMNINIKKLAQILILMFIAIIYDI